MSPEASLFLLCLMASLSGIVWLIIHERDVAKRRQQEITLARARRINVNGKPVYIDPQTRQVYGYGDQSAA